jgi:hypothetical protein
MKKAALVVGIDHYDSSPLSGCVHDAYQISRVLSTNHDNSPNFGCRLLISSNERITRSILKESLGLLFSLDADMSLFYFSGHGTANNLGGYLITQDAETYDEGVAMTDVLTMANQSSIRQIVIILDCCQSGAFGTLPAISNDKAVLREGISVLCASRSTESAFEENGSGVFSVLVLESLYGGASNIIGEVTVADIYAFVDHNLGLWDQRPLFKCHVSTLIPLRKCDPTIELSVLRLLPVYFKSPDDEYPLGPAYEVASHEENEEQRRVYSHLRAYRAAGLLKPVGTSMYFAAMKYGSCRLTTLGKYYWSLAVDGRI